ncbi:Xyloglucan-specific endo-beta-1,4-glucanase BoGH9A [Neolewinella maritima]|uniref:Endoglucanase n=1 Tax=Neolewinella maritima TaxID=1383882 RepID=A0ABM9B535_9BACT|nr:glycoside hydrolase family 9 protein [Neolewinella maritima]CAH1002418.1 Xyloglucan-specific endo-beta-1,4-glucanase BoGH9A [Neolewinella maritima]
MSVRGVSLLLLLFLTLCLLSCESEADSPPGFDGKTTPGIQFNQVGYYPDQDLQFTYVAEGRMATDRPDSTYYITNVAGDSIVRQGYLGRRQDWTALAGVLAQPTRSDPLPVGDYRIYISGAGYSDVVHVSDRVLQEPFIASVRGLYYQRAGEALPEGYAGEYARAAGHPDTDVRFHPSSGRPAGSMSCPGGWYDAGDYNKYIVNGAFPLGQYLSLYEDVGDPAPDGSLNIPESGNGRSDYLDELRTELDWMLTMQDSDGGLFHKLTTLEFEGMVLPAAATSPRYIVGKSTTASFDFAAATAQASRVYRPLDAAYADRLLAAARRAYDWGIAHPSAVFRNPADVSTGEYGDDNADDERAWAAAELFATTGEQAYYNELQARPPRIRYHAGESWTGYMANLAAFSLLRFPDRVPQELHDELRGLVITLADSLVLGIDQNPYRQPITDFEWGSNSDVLNAAMLLAAAHRQDPQPTYLTAMQDCVNYVFGNNPNGVCYLTGFGSRSPMNIHHRPSIADGIAAPVPGLLSGGPNAKQQDSAYVSYADGLAPMQSWVDEEGSYASNEICLNWNAPLTYVLGYLEANQ